MTATPAPRAKDVATMLRGPDGRLLGLPGGEYHLRMMAEVAGKSPADLLAEGYRIVTVSITEIQQEATRDAG